MEDNIEDLCANGNFWHFGGKQSKAVRLAKSGYLRLFDWDFMKVETLQEPSSIHHAYSENSLP
jgi:hypothetical protein